MGLYPFSPSYGMTIPGLNLSQFQIFDDDVSLNGATPRAVANTAANIQNGIPFRLRLEIQAGASFYTYPYMLECNINSRGWEPATSYTDVRMSASSYFNDAEVTTQRLGPGTFVTGYGIETVRSSPTITTNLGQVTELEFSLVAFYVNPGDIIRFRLIIPISPNPWTGQTTYSAYMVGSLVTPTVNVVSGGVVPPTGDNAMRAQVYESSLIGVESTPGTAVTATKRLLCTSFDENPSANIKPYRVQGAKFTTGTAASKEYTELPLNGQLCFTDAAYLFSSLLQKVTTPPAPAKYYKLDMNGASGGTFTLTYNAQVTGAITVSALTAAILADALQGLSTIGTGNVFVTGSGTAADPYLIQLTGSKATDTNTLTGSFGSVTGGVPVFTTIAAASTAKRWVFAPNVFKPDTIQTFTLERGILGTASLAMKIAYVTLAGLDLTFNKEEASLSGSAFGQITEEPFTMNTAGITDIPSIEVDPAKVGVWLGDSVAGLTRLKRCLELNLGIGAKQGPLMTLREDHTSFSDLVESNNEYAGKLTLVHDLDSINLLAKLRNKTQQVLRVEVRGPDIETNYPYRLAITTPIELLNTDRGAMDDARTGVYDFNMAYNSTTGTALQVELDVDFSAL